MIRNFCLLLTLCCAASLAAAQDRYETLLSDLANSESALEAQALSQQIWHLWLTAPDEDAQAVLDRALDRRAALDFLGAIKELDRLVMAFPDYAEGWNQRATMYYMLGDYDASLRDVAQVLMLEPRHFGALSGKAVILFNQGKVALAQITVREALKYHPFLNERAMLAIDPGTDI